MTAKEIETKDVPAEEGKEGKTRADFLRVAGVVAGAAIVGELAGAGSAEAANGETVTVGNDFAATNKRTSIWDQGVGGGNPAFLARHDGATGVQGQSFGANGVGVWGDTQAISSPNARAGVLGTSQVTGVEALGIGETSKGIYSEGGAYGVYGVANSDLGVGVRGGGNNATAIGVSGDSPKLGVYGEGTWANGIGVKGVADGADGVGVAGISADVGGVGVSGSSPNVGVSGVGTADGGVGVEGIGDIGVFANGQASGGVFIGGHAAITLAPRGGPGPPTGTSFRGEMAVDSTGVLWLCAAQSIGPTAGTWIQVSHGGVRPLATPFRTYFNPTPVNRGEERIIAITGATPGVPSNAVGIVGNLTVYDFQGGGFATLYPNGSARPTTSSINWNGTSPVPGAAIANAYTVGLGTNGSVKIYADATVAANAPATKVLLDVTAYIL